MSAELESSAPAAMTALVRLNHRKNGPPTTVADVFIFSGAVGSSIIGFPGGLTKIGKFNEFMIIIGSYKGT
jgi:hypothetical protein